MSAEMVCQVCAEEGLESKECVTCPECGYQACPEHMQKHMEDTEHEFVHEGEPGDIYAYAPDPQMEAALDKMD